MSKPKLDERALAGHFPHARLLHPSRDVTDDDLRAMRMAQQKREKRLARNKKSISPDRTCVDT